MSFPNTSGFDDVSQGRAWILIQVKYANRCCNPTCPNWIAENSRAFWLKGIGIRCMSCSGITRDDGDRQYDPWAEDDEMRSAFARYVRSKQTTRKVSSGYVTHTPGIIAALSITDEMRKYEAVKKYGIEKIIDELNAKLIDRSKRGNELFEVDLFQPSIARILQYTDPSTGEIYADFVPVEDDWKQIPIDSADAAMAWKFYLTEEEYDGLSVEG